jgi:phage tail tape-measure protein
MRDDQTRERARAGTGTLEAEPEVVHLPETEEQDQHAVGTGVGAAGGAATGAAVGGAVGGPPGALIGAAVGGVIGGFAGRGIAEAINPTEEDAFWRDNYHHRPYAAGRKYEELAPAYRYGWESRARHADHTWDQAEHHLEHGWEKARGESKLKWHEAKHAAQDAWNRVDAAYDREPDGDRGGSQGPL